jgi:cobalt-zinc-cadmium efflux system outer membrane protein
LGSTLLLAGLASACYRPAAIDEEAVLREVRAAQLSGADTGAPGAAAQAGTGLLAEDDFIRFGFANSRDLAEARAEVKVARADVDRATRWENPELRASFRDVDDDLVDRDRASVGLRWNVPRFFEQGARAASARAAIPAAEAAEADLRANLRRDIRKAFQAAVHAHRLVGLSEELVAFRREALDRAVAGATSGHTDRTDVTTAEFGLAEALAALRSASSDLDRRLGDLARLAGLASLDAARVAWPRGEPVCEAPPAGTSGLEKHAIAGSPRLAVARAGFRRWDATLAAERLRRLPWLRFVEVSYLASPRPYRDGVQFGFGIEVPLLDWNTGEIAAAEARRDLEKERFRGAMATTLRRLDDALAAWQRAWADLEKFRADIGPLAERMGQDARASVATGQRSAEDLRKVDERTLKVRRLLLEAARDCRDAMIDFERAAGSVER